MAAATDNPNGERKWRGIGKAETVEFGLLTWFKDARSRGATITSAILEEKVTQLAKKLDIPDFQATSGWLSRRKARNGIKYKNVMGKNRMPTQQLLTHGRLQFYQTCWKNTLHISLQEINNA